MKGSRRAGLPARAGWAAVFALLLVALSVVSVLAAQASGQQTDESAGAVGNAVAVAGPGAEAGGEEAHAAAPEASEPQQASEPSELVEIPNGSEPEEPALTLEREAALETPVAAAERQESRTAYTDLTPGESELLLQQSFPEQLETIDADPSRALSEVALEKVYSPTEALVSIGGETVLLESSLPVQVEEEDGKLHKVELGLEAAEGGGYVSANPLVDVSLPESAAQPISVGDEGLALTYEEGKAESSASLLDEEDLFLAEADRDTSLLLSPVSAGVEISAQLLSADSPEQLRFAVSLPDGAKLDATDDGGAAVVGSKGETLDRVTPPSAVDAQGTAIPASLEVAGDTIILSIPHRKLSVAYPIDVDPTIEEAWVVPNLLGIWHWQEAGTAGGANSYLGAFGRLVNQPYNEHWGSGAYVRSRSNVGYGAGSFGRWWYEPQGQTTYIHRAVLWGIHYEPGTCTANEPHPYVGIWNGGGWSLLSNAYPSGWATGVDSGEGNLGAGSRTVFVGIEAAGSVNLKCAHEYALTGATFFLDDPENPAVSSITGNPAGWISDQTPPFTINVGVTDPGLGVKRSTFSPEGNPPQQTPVQELGCTGAWASQCPAEHVFGYAVSAASFDQGEKKVRVTGVDALGKISNTAEFTTKVDRTPPEEELKGQLTKAIEKAEKESGSSEEAPELTLPVYNLEINATDGVLNPANGGEKRSGVKSIEVFLDKGSTPVKTWTNASCSAGNCSLSGTYTLKLNELSPDTVHTLRVLSTDFAGNKPREETLEFEYIPSTGIKNEDAMQYFPLPNGQGHEAEEEHPARPELAVNLVNGNLVYRQKDVDVEGPNADLEVERFYNSLLPNSQNSEFGDGWTLAQTPTLEPQEAKAPNPPARAAMVEETGAVQTAALPTKTGEERFDKKLQSVVTKESSGYSVEDLGEGTIEGESLKFNEAGEATELQTPGYASVEYNRSGGLLSEIAVEDPSVVPGGPEKAALEEAANEPATYLEEFGSFGTGNGQFHHPGDVAADPEGSFWVADTYNYRLQKFNAKGEFLLQVNNLGGTGEKLYPAGVATDAAGNVYEADWGNGGVYEYSPSGAFIRKIGTAGEGPGQVSRPEDVAVDGKGNIIVADTGNGRLVEFNSKGEWVRNMGTKGKGAEQLGEPTGIDVDAAGDVFVADWTNNKVMEYNEAGTFVRKWGELGSGNAQFNRPDAIAVDARGDVYVGDQENSSVKEFTGSGEFIRKFGSHGSGPGQFNLGYPMGMDIEKTGSILVTDSYGQRVERWAMVRESNSTGAPGAQADPSVAVTESSGLVQKVEGSQAGTTTYTHVGELLTAVKGTEGETRFEYEPGSAHRMSKVTLPNGTYAEIAYEPTYGRVSAITVSIAGSKKTTHFEYTDSEPRKTKVIPETEPAVTYEIGANGFVFKSWNAAVPPTIDFIAGTLHDPADLETASPIGVGTHNLSVQAHSAQGIVSMQVIANGSTVVRERLCEHPNPETECKTEAMEWVTETGDWPAGILYLEVIVTDRLGHTAAERFWVNMPYTPPPNEEEEAPRYSEILSFREQFGLDVDLHGNEEAINDRIFDLMGDWNNPHTPAGEVARATMERWGVPLRTADAAELEYRESYIAADDPAITSWGKTNAPSSYAGYYVDHRAGGLIYVGFTSNQTAQIESLRSSLAAPDRIRGFPSPPAYSLAYLEAVEAELSGISQIASEVSSVWINPSANQVVVNTTNPAHVSEVLGTKYGTAVSVNHAQALTPKPKARFSRFNRTGPVQAGDRLENAAFECTAGFGAWDQHKNANGQMVHVPFVLTAGHCFPKSGTVRRGAELGEILGEVRRDNYSEATSAVELDAEAISTEWGIVPRTAYVTPNREMQISHYVTPLPGQVVCSSGLTTNHVHCGPVLGAPRIEQSISENELVELNDIQLPVGVPVSQGDSGGPMWVMGTGEAVGLITSAHGDEFGYGECARIPENYICPITGATLVQEIIGGSKALYNAQTDHLPEVAPLPVKGPTLGSG